MVPSSACACTATTLYIRPHPYTRWAIHTKKRMHRVSQVHLPAANYHHAAKSLHGRHPCTNMLPGPQEWKQTPALCPGFMPKHESTSTSSPHADWPHAHSFSGTVLKIVLLAITQWRTCSAPSRRHTRTLLDMSARRSWAKARMYRFWPTTLGGLCPYSFHTSASLATASARRADIAGRPHSPGYYMRFDALTARPD